MQSNVAWAPDKYGSHESLEELSYKRVLFSTESRTIARIPLSRCMSSKYKVIKEMLLCILSTNLFPTSCLHTMQIYTRTGDKGSSDRQCIRFVPTHDDVGTSSLFNLERREKDDAHFEVERVIRVATIPLYPLPIVLSTRRR